MRDSERQGVWCAESPLCVPSMPYSLAAVSFCAWGGNELTIVREKQPI